MRLSPKDHVILGNFNLPFQLVFYTTLVLSKSPMGKMRYMYTLGLYLSYQSYLATKKLFWFFFLQVKVPLSMTRSVLCPFPDLADAPRRKNGNWYPLT